MSYPDELVAGTRFGRYEIVRLIGGGAMGRVYEAIMVELHKRVAIKTLASQFSSDTSALERFLREGRAAARVRHSHLVQIFDVGIEQGVPFLAMEYLEGNDLRARIDKGVANVAEFIDLMVPIVAALAAAHDAGVIHRDLKPENIFIAEEHGEVRPVVVDFGVSKLSDGSVHLTRTASMMGTPLYMSPQQAGDAREVDARTDQYSLAVVMFEGLCGQLPYQAQSLMELVTKLSEGRHPKPTELRPELSPELERAVLRAMHRDPAERFPDMYALGAALLPFASPVTQARYARLFSTHAASSTLASVPAASTVAASAAASPVIVGSAAPAVRAVSGVDEAPGRSAGGVDRTEVSGAAAASAATPLKTTLGQGATSVSNPVGRKQKTSLPRLIAGVVFALAAFGAAIALLGRRDEPAPVPALSGSAAAPEETYVVNLTVLPSDAEIVLDGESAARGNLTTRLPLDGVSHSIVIKREGYESQSVTFLDAPPPERFELSKVPEPKASASEAPEVKPAPPEPAVRVFRRPSTPAGATKAEKVNTSGEKRPSSEKTPVEKKRPSTANDAPILE